MASLLTKITNWSDLHNAISLHPSLGDWERWLTRTGKRVSQPLVLVRSIKPNTKCSTGWSIRRPLKIGSIKYGKALGISPDMSARYKRWIPANKENETEQPFIWKAWVWKNYLT